MEIINKQSLQVIGIQVIAQQDYLFTEIPHAWDILFKRIEEIRGKIDNRFMDISVKKEGKLCTQLLCIEVNSLSYMPDGMFGMKFPQQKYISFKHTGTIYGVPDSFDKMNKWAKENGYRTGDFKIDYGYYYKEREPIEHTLYLAVKDKL